MAVCNTCPDELYCLLILRYSLSMNTLKKPRRNWHAPFPDVLSWFRFHFRWKGWRTKMPNGPKFPHNQPELAANWKAHRCADGNECRSSLTGGCSSGWCMHFHVRPDGMGVSRLPPEKVIPVLYRPKKTKAESRQ